MDVKTNIMIGLVVIVLLGVAVADLTLSNIAKTDYVYTAKSPIGRTLFTDVIISNISCSDVSCNFALVKNNNTLRNFTFVSYKMGVMGLKYQKNSTEIINERNLLIERYLTMQERPYVNIGGGGNIIVK